ncbi:thiamine phosphate synthase [bacterium]|nr:MAG: thiamine phosphate synthase [bacterium]
MFSTSPCGVCGKQQATPSPSGRTDVLHKRLWRLWMNAVADSRLTGIYAILGHEGALERLDACLEVGIRVVQYRGKAAATLEMARALAQRCRSAGALLIVNDDLELALAAGAGGLHLGQEDAGGADLAAVRRRLGPAILGLSTHDAEQARRAAELGADYVGAGCVFPTRSKERVIEIGVEGLRRIVAASPLPVVAIGGIDANNVREVRASGAAMAAVIGAIAGAPDARAAVRALTDAWDG